MSDTANFTLTLPPEYSSESAQRSMLMDLRRAILQEDIPAIQSVMAQLDILSANEAMRQLGQEWRFITAEITGIPHRIMLLRDLAFLGYGYPHTGRVGELLRHAGRQTITIGRYNDNRGTLIRQAFHLPDTDTRAAFATWEDVLIVGMRGQTDYAKRLQRYLLKAERENRIRWTLERISQAIERTTLPVEALCGNRPLQIDRSKKHNTVLAEIVENGASRSIYRNSWRSVHQDHTGRDGKHWEKRGKAEGVKFSGKRGDSPSQLQYIRALFPEGGDSIAAFCDAVYVVKPKDEQEYINFRVGFKKHIVPLQDYFAFLRLNGAPTHESLGK